MVRTCPTHLMAIGFGWLGKLAVLSGESFRFGFLDSRLGIYRLAPGSQCCSLADLCHHLYMRDGDFLRACLGSRIFVGFRSDFDLLAVVVKHGAAFSVEDEAFAVSSGQIEIAVHVHEATS